VAYRDRLAYLSNRVNVGAVILHTWPAVNL
jgi:hypothetical protein